MLFECVSNPAWPYFLTLTYANWGSNPPDVEGAMSNWKNFVKAWRRRLGPVRYFHSIELGSKTGRLHHHAIVWSQDFQDLPAWSPKTRTDEKKCFLERAWLHGFTQHGKVRGPAGLGYAAKYVTKGQFRISFSQKPMLGRKGLDQVLQVARSTGRPVPRLINKQVLNRVCKIYLPEKDFLQARLISGGTMKESPEKVFSTVWGVPKGTDLEWWKTKRLLNGAQKTTEF